MNRCKSSTQKNQATHSCSTVLPGQPYNATTTSTFFLRKKKHSSNQLGPDRCADMDSAPAARRFMTRNPTEIAAAETYVPATRTYCKCLPRLEGRVADEQIGPTRPLTWEQSTEHRVPRCRGRRDEQSSATDPVQPGHGWSPKAPRKRPAPEATPSVPRPDTCDAAAERAWRRPHECLLACCRAPPQRATSMCAWCCRTVAC